ncbi:MAG TPA: hypothetical protein VIJ18_05670 [Microbacteriaceae bacterium]
MSFPTGYTSLFGDDGIGRSPAEVGTVAGIPVVAPLTRRELRERERAATDAVDVIASPDVSALAREEQQELKPESLFDALWDDAAPTAPEQVDPPAMSQALAVQALVATATLATRRQRRERDAEVITAETQTPRRSDVRDSKRVDARRDKRGRTRSASRRVGDAVPAVPQAPVPVKQSVRLRAADTDARPPHQRTSQPSKSQQRTSRHPVRKRKLSSLAAMLAAAGLVTTFALPAYAISSNTGVQGKALASQSLSVANVVMPKDNRETYTMIENVAAWDSTLGTTVPSTVQALAEKIMSAVAAGRLTGSVPDHIPEIRNLAQGIAVPGCGVDYRVLQVIEVALDNFSTVGVSDINRRCTGQIEGAGTASAHYADGGGHAVDFDRLNGQGLTGGDANSVRLIRILDPLVPPGSHVGQQECRSSMSLTNLVAFDDTCDHLHIDFGQTAGASLRD